MTRIRAAKCKAWVAVLASAALLVQAALASLAPPRNLAAAAFERLAPALCLGSGAQPKSPDRAPPAGDRTHQRCCILCAVPGLGANAAAPKAIALSWGPPLAAPLPTYQAERAAQALERSPIRARAPPLA